MTGSEGDAPLDNGETYVEKVQHRQRKAELLTFCKYRSKISSVSGAHCNQDCRKIKEHVSQLCTNHQPVSHWTGATRCLAPLLLRNPVTDLGEPCFPRRHEHKRSPE